MTPQSSTRSSSVILPTFSHLQVGLAVSDDHLPSNVWFKEAFFWTDLEGRGLNLNPSGLTTDLPGPVFQKSYMPAKGQLKKKRDARQPLEVLLENYDQPDNDYQYT